MGRFFTKKNCVDKYMKKIIDAKRAREGCGFFAFLSFWGKGGFLGWEGKGEKETLQFPFFEVQREDEGRNAHLCYTYTFCMDNLVSI